MSDTSTTTAPETTTETTIDLAGAFGATSVRLVGAASVDIPPAVRAALTSELNYFASAPNSEKRELIMPTESAAATLRAQITAFGKEHNRTAYLPERNKAGDLLNDGVRVTYRFNKPRKESDASKSGPVVVTNVADKAGADKATDKAGADKATDKAVKAAA